MNFIDVLELFERDPRTEGINFSWVEIRWERREAARTTSASSSRSP